MEHLALGYIAAAIALCLWLLNRLLRRGKNAESIAAAADFAKSAPVEEESGPLHFQYNPNAFSPFASAVVYKEPQMIPEYFLAPSAEEIKPAPSTPTSSQSALFEGCRLLSNEDFVEQSSCDKFSVSDMLKEGWEQRTDEETVIGFSRDFGDTGLKQVRARAVIYGVRPAQIFNCIWDFNLSMKWGDAWDESILIEQINALNQCVYLRAPLPSGVTLRDFVQFRGCQFDRADDPNFCLILFRNALHPTYSLDYTEKRGYIRGETLGIIGYSVRSIPVPDGTPDKFFRNRPRIACQVSITTCFDLKGLVPRWLVNWVAAKAPVTWAVNLQKAVDSGLGMGQCQSPLTGGQTVSDELLLNSTNQNAAVDETIPSGGSDKTSNLRHRL